MKPSLALSYAPQRHLTRLLTRPSLLLHNAAKQLRRASVVHNDLLPLMPHKLVRNLQQAPPAAPEPVSTTMTTPAGVAVGGGIAGGGLEGLGELLGGAERTEAVSRAVLDKYRDKLVRKAREEGVDEDVDALKEVYREKIKAVRRQNAETFPTPPPSSPTSSSPSPSPSPPRLPTATAIKPLSSILDLPKIRTLPNPELSTIWRLRHAKNPTSLCATIPSRTYLAMDRLARLASPQFVLPVPHDGEGAELHFLQWTFGSGGSGAPESTTSVLFTSLAEYKLKGEFAQPHTTITHHLDLVGERGLVLMEGAVVEGRGTTVEQARWLVMNLQRFYGALEDEEAEMEMRAQGREEPAAVAYGRRTRRQLVEWFGKGDPRFNVNVLLEEAQRVG